MKKLKFSRENIYLFNELDTTSFDMLTYNVYWPNPGGSSNNEPVVNEGNHIVNEVYVDKHISTFYNYPNPLKNNTTTFRFFTREVDKAEIKIYTISGFLVDTIYLDFLDDQEYNETTWQSLDNNAGLYICHLSVFAGTSVKESKIIKIIIPQNDE